MPEITPNIEIENKPPVETVRCIIENAEGEILLLQKAPDSKASDLFEFPGGKIDDIKDGKSTEEEQLDAVRNEVLEETGMNISSLTPEKAGWFDYDFSANGKQYQRRVHVFHLKLSSSDQAVTINTTMNQENQSEDKHALFVWKRKSELVEMKKKGQLSGNSLKFEKALGIPVDLIPAPEQPSSTE